VAGEFSRVKIIERFKQNSTSDIHMDKLQNYINGQWVDGLADEISTHCPNDDSVVAAGKSASLRQVDDAFAAAREAFGAWWDVGSDQRVDLVERYAALVRENADELADLIARETGKPFWETKTEAAAVVGKVAVSIDSMRERRSKTSFEMGQANAVTRYKPHGICGVLGPFNFPAHLPNGHIVPALICGNTVVFKPSEITPATGVWMMQKWHEAGLPAGVLNLVQGGREIGEAIASHDELDGLFFTGSSRAGVALSKTLAPTPQKILALEMGGNNPLIVHETNDVKAAAYLTVLSAYITAGQRCTCARRLIVVDGEPADRFLLALKSSIEGIKVGFNTDSPEPFFGTVINDATGKRLLEAQSDLIARGATPIVEMKRLRDCDALVSPGLLDVTDVGDREDEEHFGPLLTLIRVGSLDEAIAEANRTKYGLSAGLLSDNAEVYQQFIHQIRAGIVNWNRQTTGASGKLPFGGCGLSGNHRPSAYFAVDYCSFPVASIEAETLSMPDKKLPGIE
jgi:succinylglutamic semialdehyde dehydrogenase